MQVLALNNDEGTVKSVPFLCRGGYKVNLPCKTKKAYKKKYLTEAKLKGYIHKLANEQQGEMDKAIEEYNRRMEEQLLVYS